MINIKDSSVVNDIKFLLMSQRYYNDATSTYFYVVASNACGRS